MLQKIFSYFTLPLLIFLLSCSKGHGLHTTAHNITVYYEETSQEKMAKEILEFFKAIKISPSHQMDLKLIKLERKFQLLFIKGEAFKAEDLDFEEIKIFLDLQQQLNAKVSSFTATPCEIAIANNQFEVLEIPNPI